MTEFFHWLTILLLYRMTLHRISDKNGVYSLLLSFWRVYYKAEIFTIRRVKP